MWSRTVCIGAQHTDNCLRVIQCTNTTNTKTMTELSILVHNTSHTLSSSYNAHHHTQFQTLSDNAGGDMVAGNTIFTRIENISTTFTKSPLSELDQSVLFIKEKYIGNVKNYNFQKKVIHLEDFYRTCFLHLLSPKCQQHTLIDKKSFFAMPDQSSSTILSSSSTTECALKLTNK